VNGTRPKACSPDKTYVTRAGDSCDSIATAHKVSSSTLYHTNPNLRDCGNPDEGISLCLPEACEIYSVQPNASCVTLAVDQGVSWMNIVDWNAGIDSRCSNIVGAKPSWGSTICVSPPGGRFSGNPGNSTVSGNGNTGGQGGSGDGYAENLVKVPQGTVAPGTTVECGEYVRAQAGNSCSRMVSQAAVPMDLFIQANPSLESAISCTSKLQVGTWYCLRPWRNWNSKKSA
jgi:LysM repeat protein